MGAAVGNIMATIMTTTDIMRSRTIRKSRMKLGSGVISATTIISTTMGTPSSLTFDKLSGAAGFADAGVGEATRAGISC